MVLGKPEFPFLRYWKQLDFKTLVSGFIRSHCTSSPDDEVPSELINLCRKFGNPSEYKHEANDPINSISQDDVAKSDCYKVEGNECFRNKNYQHAIIKYTTALMYNPNNHLIFSNRAFCHFLTQQLKEATEDIVACIEREPAFVKGWYRYGLILEQTGRLGMAGIAFVTALKLTQGPQQRAPSNNFLIREKYHKFMKMLRKRGQNNKEHLEYIKRFDEDHRTPMWDSFQSLEQELAKESPEIRAVLKWRDESGDITGSC